MTKLRVFTIRAILDNKQQHGNTGNGKDKLSYTTTTLITTTDKHGVPPTKRLFRVAMLDPSQGFIDPLGGKFGDLATTKVWYVPSKVVFDALTFHFEIWPFGLRKLNCAVRKYSSDGERAIHRGSKFLALRPSRLCAQARSEWGACRPYTKLVEYTHVGVFCKLCEGLSQFLTNRGIFIDGGLKKEEKPESKIFLAVRVFQLDLYDRCEVSAPLVSITLKSNSWRRRNPSSESRLGILFCKEILKGGMGVSVMHYAFVMLR
ncbi:hypothetical protein Tco_0743617 [Tanacetum coccineum]